jgi:hypothetical protein
MEVETKKRQQILFLEKQAALQEKNGLGASNPAFDVLEKDAESGEEEEDEELAMAKQLEHSEVKSDAGDDAVEEDTFQGNDEGSENDDIMLDDAQDQLEVDGDKPTDETITPASSPAKLVASVVSPSGSREASNKTLEEDANVDGNEAETFDTNEPTESENDPMQTGNVDENTTESNQEQDDPDDAELAEETKTKSNKPRNSAWQEMLRKEKEMLAKQKKIQRKGGGLVEGEAEEEEEEEGIVGLEDFGFSVEKVRETVVFSFCP